MKKTLNVGGKLLDLSIPKVMGIINLTPDSFYDGGLSNELDSALHQTEKHLKEGASFIDFGGYSTRPGGDFIPEVEELKRVIPIVEQISKEFPKTVISIDTFRASIAKESLEVGAHMINDISFGRFDKQMFSLVKNKQVPYVGMHSVGQSDSLHKIPPYPDGITLGVKDYFVSRVEELRKMGLHDLILDVGFGFGKTIKQNYQLLNELDLIKKMFELPILVGLSRKSMIYKTLKVSAKKALNGSTALHTISLLKGADILRVHDVREAIECVKLVGELSDFFEGRKWDSLF